MMRINAARKSILADNSEQFRTIQREKNPSSRKQVPRSKKQQIKMWRALKLNFWTKLWNSVKRKLWVLKLVSTLQQNYKLQIISRSQVFKICYFHGNSFKNCFQRVALKKSNFRIHNCYFSSTTDPFFLMLKCFSCK